jgi:hypothetical protein
MYERRAADILRSDGSEAKGSISHVKSCIGRVARPCILDGDAVASGEDGIALFGRLCDRRYDATVFL